MNWIKKLFKKRDSIIDSGSFNEWYLQYRNEMSKAFSVEYAIEIASWSFRENHKKYFTEGLSPKEAVLEYMQPYKNQLQVQPNLEEMAKGQIPSNSERIICAAVWYQEIPIKKQIPYAYTNPINCPTGLVFCGHRHAQCIYTKCSIIGLRDAESGENKQGFLTSKNRFVSREEALSIALRENQVMEIKEIRGDRLHSEDLY